MQTCCRAARQAAGVELPDALGRRATSSHDGAVWLAHLHDNDDVALVSKVHEPIGGAPDELFLRHVVDMAGRLGLPGVLVAVARADGRVRRVDRRFGQELATRLAGTPTRFRGLYVVGRSASRPVTSAGPKPVNGRHPRHPERPRSTDRPRAQREQQHCQADGGTDG